VHAVEGDADPRVGCAGVVDGDVGFVLLAFDEHGAVGDHRRRDYVGGLAAADMVMMCSPFFQGD
jgi:hypothetical protein